MKRFYGIIIMVASLMLVGCSSIGNNDNDKSTAATIESNNINQTTLQNEDTSSLLIDNVNGDSKYTNAEISQMYKEVLKSERSFISVEEGNKEVLLKD